MAMATRRELARLLLAARRRRLPRSARPVREALCDSDTGHIANRSPGEEAIPSKKKAKKDTLLSEEDDDEGKGLVKPEDDDEEFV